MTIKTLFDVVYREHLSESGKELTKHGWYFHFIPVDDIIDGYTS
jgi:hypothetical protein